jgi:Zn-dependent proteases
VPKIRIHPLFLVLSAAIVVLSGILDFAFTILAVVLHELSHTLAAYERGYKANKITLLPYGAVLTNEENLDKTSAIIIALAGPFANFLLAVLTVSLWWLFPATYAVTESFVYANLVIGLFNLIPVFPLDGSRILLAFSKNTSKTLKALKFAGVLLSFSMLGLFIVSAFFEINLTLGVMSIFLYVGAVSGTRREMYAHMLSCSPVAKDYRHGVKAETVYVSASLTLRRVLKMVSPKTESVFIVMDGGKKLTSITEERLWEIMQNNPLKATLISSLRSNKASKKSD